MRSALIDPDDPTRFTLDAHDDEVMIIWRDLHDRDEMGKADPQAVNAAGRWHVEGYETVEVTSTARGVEDARKLIIGRRRKFARNWKWLPSCRGIFQQDKKNEADALKTISNSGCTGATAARRAARLG